MIRAKLYFQIVNISNLKSRDFSKGNRANISFNSLSQAMLYFNTFKKKIF